MVTAQTAYSGYNRVPEPTVEVDPLRGQQIRASWIDPKIRNSRLAAVIAFHTRRRPPYRQRPRHLTSAQYARGVAQHHDAAGKSLSTRTGTHQVAALARQSISCRTDNWFLPGRRGRTGGGLPQSEQIRPCRAGVFRVHRLECRQSDQLWRAISRWRTYLLMPGGIIGESASPNVSRCSGRSAVRTCCCRPEPARSMARSALFSRNGIPVSPTIKRLRPLSPRQHKNPRDP